MTFVGVPWFVGGGAENPVEGARIIANRIFDGRDGAANPDDCLPHESASPDANIVIDSGVLVVRNTADGTSQESYLCPNPDPVNVAITPTGSGGGRVDLVYLRVDDPQYGADAPADIANGPYLSLEVVESVNPTSKSIAAAITNGDLDAGTVGVAIALVTLPALTNNITDAMITDLRPMARDARRERRLLIPTVTAAADISGTTYTGATLSGNTVVVPTWATRMNVVAHCTVGFSGVIANNQSVAVKARFLVNGTQVAETVQALGTLIFEGPTYTGATSGLRATLPNFRQAIGPMSHTRTVTPGETITFAVQGRRTGTQAIVGQLPADGAGGHDVTFDIEFVEE